MQVEQRKRPVQQRATATVAYILDAATHILEAEGLGGLTTNAVARRAGVSIGSLYQYFPGKEAIVAALILREHERIVAAVRVLTVDSEGMSARAAISTMLHMLVDLHAGSPRVSAILEAEETRLPKTAEVIAAEREIGALNALFFRRYLGSAHDDPATIRQVGEDIVGIVRALLDAAARSGGLGAADLHDRLLRTVEGYLAPLMKGRMQ